MFLSTCSQTLFGNTLAIRSWASDRVGGCEPEVRLQMKNGEWRMENEECRMENEK